MSALGQIDLDPNHGESDGARWFMTEEDSVAFASMKPIDASLLDDRSDLG